MEGVRQGCPLSPTLFNNYLEDLTKNCFLTTVGANIGGRRIKCIRFADIRLLAEDERMLKNMLMELNDRCGDYGVEININKSKTMVIGRKPKIDRRIKDESVEQVDSFKYLGCNISSNMNYCQEVKRRIARQKKLLTGREAFYTDPWKRN